MNAETRGVNAENKTESLFAFKPKMNAEIRGINAEKYKIESFSAVVRAVVFAAKLRGAV
jgi:hypothetical protein